MKKKIITMKFFLHKKERFFLKVGEGRGSTLPLFSSLVKPLRIGCEKEKSSLLRREEIGVILYYKSFLLNLIKLRNRGMAIHTQRISSETPIPPPLPKISLNIAPVAPSIAATSNCKSTKIRERPIGLSAVRVAIVPSIG